MPDSENASSPAPRGSATRRNIIVATLAILAVVATTMAIRIMREAPVAGQGGPGGAPMAMPPAAVFVESVVAETAQAEAIVTGVLRPVSQANVAAREPGAILKVLVNEGDSVSKDDVIVQLDARRLAAQLAEAKAGLASATSLAVQRKAEADRAKSDLAMKRGLLGRKAVSQSDVLDAEKVLAVAGAQRDAATDGIAEAQSRLRFLQLQREDLTIRAPFDGVIVDRGVEPGEWVAAGAVVASLVTVDPIEAWLRVPVRHLDQLSTEPENFRVRRSSTSQLLDPSKIEIVPQVEPLSQLFTVIATLPNPAGRLAPGESVTGIVPVGKRESHWRISTDAVIQTAAGYFVHVVEKPPKAGALPGARWTRVDVKFERNNHAYLTVASGVFAEGDLVIVEGNERLAPGQSLLVKSREETTGAPGPAGAP